MNFCSTIFRFLLVSVILISLSDNTDTRDIKYTDIFHVPGISEYLEQQGYTQTNNFIVTAYLAIDEYENRFHGITFSGVPAIPFHTVAVDPKVVPLGSQLFIEGLGWWKAEDTGNMIKGNRLDICLPTRDEAVEWGKRNRQVWFKPPKDFVEDDKTSPLLLSDNSVVGES